MEAAQKREEETLVALALCFLGNETPKFTQRMNELIQQRKRTYVPSKTYQERETRY
jgi:hypothetical protein